MSERSPRVVELARVGSVAWVTLNRPHRRNALDTAAWIQLQAALNAVAGDDENRVLVITGAGQNFCSGIDVSVDTVASHRTQLERMQWFHEIVLTLHRLPIPTIAAVDGLALGIGMNLALACDFVVATDRAQFAEIFIRRALSVDGGGSWLLPRLVGVARAKQLCLLGDMIGATEAHSMGLIAEVVGVDTLTGTVDDLATRLVGSSRLALAQTKALLNESASLTFEQSLQNEARAQAINVASDDFAAALEEFRRAAAERAVERNSARV